MSRPRPSTSDRHRQAVAALGGALAVCALSAAPAAAQQPAPAVLDRATTAGPPAEIAWTSGVRIRVRSPGAPDRTVATMPRGDSPTEVALSRDGRFLVATGPRNTFLVRIADGGRPARLGDAVGRGATGVRWAPDGRQVVLLDGGAPRLCVVLPSVSCRRADSGAAIDEYGASWSPDSTRLAFIRSGDDSGSDEAGDLVTVDHVRGGDLRVIERARRTGSGRTYPVPPVWTRGGLVFSSYTESGRNGGTVRRVRTRIVQPDGRVHTLTAGAVRDGADLELPFLASSDSPSGEIVGLTITGRPRGTEDAIAITAGLRVLDLQGRLRPYGIDYRGTDSAFAEPLGITADGRVALSVTTESGPSRLYVRTPGSSGLGKPVVSGGSVDAVVAYPNETRGF